MDPEAAHGRAYANLPAPISNTKVDVKLDGRAIAAAVSTLITRDNRTVTSTNDYDGRAGFASPDTRN